VVDPSEHRVSDADREAVADRLRTAAGDGRLDPDELEERVAAAYAARTRGDLLPLTADLPDVRVQRRESDGALDTPVLRRQLGAFLTANVVCWSIWLATGAEANVWPKWVVLGTGLALVVTLIRVLVVGPDDVDSPPGRDRPGAR
jgi:Domain of unknown function (DUF1707)